jgi:hypothetical protein
LTAHKRIISGGILAAVPLILSSNPSLASGPTRLTNLDKKAIAALVLRRELVVPRAGNETTILVSPRTYADWLPEIPGVRFRRLAYEEEKLVREYIELWFLEHPRYVEAHFEKGNYCDKSGTVYRFRRENSVWRGEAIGPSSLQSGFGSACPGCELGTRYSHTSTEAGPPPVVPAPSPEPLVLEGSVLAARCSNRVDAGHVECEADLRLRFSNAGSEPLIILQPFQEYKFWHGGTSLALTSADPTRADYVYTSSAWPSVYDTPEYRSLGEALDQRSPPAGLTRILSRGESWQWDTTVHLVFTQDNNCGRGDGVEIGWKEIQNLQAPLWLRVSYEIWPFNVENFKPDLGGRLRKRWKRHGTLYLDEKSRRYWFARITSEPIELDPRRLSLNERFP